MSEKEPITQTALDSAVGRGMVFRKSQGRYSVSTDDGTAECSISSRLRKYLEYPIAAPWSIRPHVVAVHDIREVDPIAVGDIVRFVDAGDGTGVIVEVLPRKSELARRAAGKKPLKQVIVANVDQVVVVFAAAQPKPKWEALDRYLAVAEASELPAVVCITKLDLGTRNVEKEVQDYQRIGYRAILTSAMTGMGLAELGQTLRGRVSVLAGPSGVGKTTLLNTIQPGLGLRVAEVSRSTGKGRHTTSHLEMFSLDDGGSVVDLPGMRELGLWDVGGADVDGLFPEMRPYIGRCRFGLDCSHTHEPGCAIKDAVESGSISERRYRSCLRMREKSVDP